MDSIHHLVPFQTTTAPPTPNQATAVDGLVLAVLAAFVVIICVFVAVLVGQGYIKDFKQTKSKVKQRISEVFKEESETCNYCGESLPPSHDPQADCPFCDHKPYQISDLIGDFNDTMCATPGCHKNLTEAEKKQGVTRVDRCPECGTRNPYSR